jgi:hypothetical protein
VTHQEASDQLDYFVSCTDAATGDEVGKINAYLTQRRQVLDATASETSEFELTPQKKKKIKTHTLERVHPPGFSGKGKQQVSSRRELKMNQIQLQPPRIVTENNKTYVDLQPFRPPASAEGKQKLSTRQEPKINQIQLQPSPRILTEKNKTYTDLQSFRQPSASADGKSAIRRDPPQHARCSCDLG